MIPKSKKYGVAVLLPSLLRGDADDRDCGRDEELSEDRFRG